MGDGDRAKTKSERRPNSRCLKPLFARLLGRGRWERETSEMSRSKDASFFLLSAPDLHVVHCSSGREIEARVTFPISEIEIAGKGISRVHLDFFFGEHLGASPKDFLKESGHLLGGGLTSLTTPGRRGDQTFPVAISLILRGSD